MAILRGFVVFAALLGSVGAYAAGDVYQDIYNAVDQAHIQKLLMEMTGVVPATVGGKSVSITDRYSATSKATWRAYFTQYFQSLGIDVTEMPYPTAHKSIEAQGHNVEAILPGASKDSFVVIVHYDSMGPLGQETKNPGVDDDMTGMTTLMETAKVLAAYKGRLQHTVRFVAADFEEWSGPGLEGARKYAAYLKALAAKEGWKIIGAVDDEQSGWNCYTTDHQCAATTGGKTTFAASCSENGVYSYKEIGDVFDEVAKQYTDLRVDRECETADSDHYAMWEIGVPTVVFSEPYGNPHYDGAGGDTYARIDLTYFEKLSRLGVVFAAKVIGVN